MELKFDLLNSSLYYGANVLLMKVFEVISFWLLVKLLPKESIGLIGVVVGFISILGLFNILPYRMLYKGFSEINSEFNRHVSAYIVFWAAQSVVMLVVTFAAWALLFSFSGNIMIILFGLVISFLLSNLQSIFQEAFFVQFRQKSATVFNAVSTVLFMAMLLALALFPSVELYAALIAVKGIFVASGFFLFARKEIGFIFSIPHDAWKISMDALKGFAIADHMIGTAIDIISKSFLFIAGFLATESMTGNFTVAFSLANILSYAPNALYRTAMLALTRVSTKKGIGTVLFNFTKYSLVLSLAQFVLLLITIGAIVPFFVSENTAEVIKYTVLLAIGFTLFNIGRPMHAVALLKAPAEKMLLFVIAPAAVACVAGYAAAFYIGEPWLIGVVFIVTIICIMLGTALLVSRETGVYLSGEVFSRDEKELVMHAISKVRANIPGKRNQ